MRLADHRKIVEIRIVSSYTRADFSGDFFEDATEYDEEHDAYIVNDVDYCIAQAEDFVKNEGDYYIEEPEKYAKFELFVNEYPLTLMEELN